MHARDLGALEQLLGQQATARCAALNLASRGQNEEQATGLLLAAARRGDITMQELDLLTILLRRQRRESEILPLLQRCAGIFSDPRERYFYFLLIENQLRMSGRTAEAGQQQRRLAQAVVRGDAPFLLYRYQLDHADLREGAAADSSYEAAAGIALSRHAYDYCASALDRLVHKRLDQGAMAGAIALAPRAISCADSSAIPYWQSVTRARYGRALSKAGRFAQAERVLVRGLSYAQRTRSPYEIADVWHNLAHNYEASGRWSEARRAVALFAENASRLEGESIDIVSLRDAGIIFWDSGDPATARRYFERMVSAVSKYHHESYWAGEYFERIGDLERARTYYHAALLEGGDTGRITTGLLRVYQALGSADSAAAAANMHDRAHFTPEEVPLLPELAAQQGRFAYALDMTTAFAQKQESQHNVSGAANAWLQVAEIALRAGRNQQALRAASRGQAMARRAQLNTERIRAWIIEGSASEDGTGISKLMRAVREARQSGQPLLEADAWGGLVDRYLAKGDEVRALSAMDSALHARRHTKDTFEDAFDRVRYQERIANRLDRGAWHAVVQRNAQRLLDWEVRRKANRAPHFLLGGLRARMAARDALVDYVVTDSGVAALVVTRSRAAVIPLKTNRAALQQLVMDLRGATASAFGQIDLARARFDYGAAGKLDGALVQPLQLTESNWLIVPDGPLHLLPFEVLIETQSNQQHFLIDRMTSTYAQSPDATPATGSIDLRALSVLADATPGVDEEIAAIRAVVPTTRIVRNASERTARQAVRAGGVLHFAVHAQADADRPLSSYLKLRADDADDGFYRLHEIEADHPSARLVVLSACATVAGRLYRAGPFSIARAFTSGPQTSVVATEWPVGSSTAHFSAVFYQQLRTGATVPAAVRRAKLAMKRSPATSNPLLWAPFVVVNGEPF